MKITVALGQRGTNDNNGCGGTFVVLETDTGPDPIFVAGGAAACRGDSNYCKASLRRTGKGNDQIGSSGLQSFSPNDEHPMNVYCAGAGFFDGPNGEDLEIDSVPPQSYAQGLKGGKKGDQLIFQKSTFKLENFNPNAVGILYSKDAISIIQNWIVSRLFANIFQYLNCAEEYK